MVYVGVFAMSGLTDEELRAACEASGLVEHDHLPGHWLAKLAAPCGHLRPGDTVSFHQQNPALPAYVASLLVTRVREERDWYADELYKLTGTVAGDPFVATDAQRIRAAMEVLNGQ